MSIPISLLLLVIKTNHAGRSKHILIKLQLLLIIQVLYLLAIGCSTQRIGSHIPIGLILINKLVLPKNTVEFVPEHRKVVRVNLRHRVHWLCLLSQEHLLERERPRQYVLVKLVSTFDRIYELFVGYQASFFFLIALARLFSSLVLILVSSSLITLLLELELFSLALDLNLAHNKVKEHL